LLITSSQSFKLQVVFFLAATEAHPGRVRVADGEHQSIFTHTAKRAPYRDALLKRLRRIHQTKLV
jgi:hypothetical protein